VSTAQTLLVSFAAGFAVAVATAPVVTPTSMLFNDGWPRIGRAPRGISQQARLSWATSTIAQQYRLRIDHIRDITPDAAVLFRNRR
jgi:hypothetical protein